MRLPKQKKTKGTALVAAIPPTSNPIMQLMMQNKAPEVLTLTAAEWRLHGGEGSAEAAVALNSAFNRALFRYRLEVAFMLPRTRIAESVIPVMRKYAHLGALEPECVAVLYEQRSEYTNVLSS